MPSSEKTDRFDRYTPAKALFSWAKRAGFSKQIAATLSRYATSPRRLAKTFDGYVPTSRDVIVATTVKSGTNWMLQICQQIAHRGQAEFEHIHDVVPWPDSIDRQGIALDDQRSWAKSPTGMRVIKTHCEAEYVPYNSDATYVIVLRDPKDVTVSAYHFATALFGISDTLSPQDFLQISQNLGSGTSHPWVRHTLGWWGLRDRPNVLILNFREMKKDLRSAVKQVAATMGVELTDAELEAVVERSSLPYMKGNNAKFSPVGIPFVTPSHIPKMIRKGQSGGASELYSQEEQAQIDRSILEALDKVGSDFPYRDFFDVVDV